MTYTKMCAPKTRYYREKLQGLNHTLTAGGGLITTNTTTIKHYYYYYYYRGRPHLRTSYFERGSVLVGCPNPSTSSYLPCSYFAASSLSKNGVLVLISAPIASLVCNSHYAQVLICRDLISSSHPCPKTVSLSVFQDRLLNWCATAVSITALWWRSTALGGHENTGAAVWRKKTPPHGATINLLGPKA